MKQKFYLIIPALLLFSSLSAQVPNGSFENWTAAKDYTPKFWTKLTGTVSKVDLIAGNKAIKLENILLNENYSALVSGTFNGYDSSGSPLAGFPYTNTPDSLKITWKYNLALGDTFSVACYLKKAGVGNVRIAFGSFNGSNNNYHTTSIPFTILDTLAPDSAFILITSGNLDEEPLGNGFVEIDKVSFTDSFNAVSGVIPNGDFNNWDSVGYDKLNSWITTNDVMNLFGISPITPNAGKVTAAYNGTYAIELRNIKASTGDTIGGAAMTFSGIGFPNEDEPQFAINKRYNTLEGFLMYTPGNLDRATIKINVFKDTLVGSGEFYYDTIANSYTKFVVPIEYSPAFSGVPDSATILISSADMNTDPTSINSTLIVDYLTLTQWSSGINSKGALAMKMNAFPNPANSSINFTYQQEKSGNTNIEINDLTGKVISTTNVNNAAGKQLYNFNVSNLNNGVYIAKVNTGTQTGIIKFTVQK